MGRILLLSTTLVLMISGAAAHAFPPVRIGIGLNFGAPFYYRPYGYPYWYGGYGYPYVVPGPVVYQAPPVVIQQPATVVATTPSYSAPTFTGPEPTPVNPTAQGNLDFHLSRLSNPDE